MNGIMLAPLTGATRKRQKAEEVRASLITTTRIDSPEVLQAVASVTDPAFWLEAEALGKKKVAMEGLFGLIYAGSTAAPWRSVIRANGVGDYQTSYLAWVKGNACEEHDGIIQALDEFAESKALLAAIGPQAASDLKKSFEEACYVFWNERVEGHASPDTDFEHTRQWVAAEPNRLRRRLADAAQSATMSDKLFEMAYGHMPEELEAILPQLTREDFRLLSDVIDVCVSAKVSPGGNVTSDVLDSLRAGEPSSEYATFWQAENACELPFFLTFERKNALRATVPIKPRQGEGGVMASGLHLRFLGRLSDIPDTALALLAAPVARRAVAQLVPLTRVTTRA